MKLEFSVPASFLLTGEYFITEPGEWGCALASFPVVTIAITPADSLQCRTLFGGKNCAAEHSFDLAHARPDHSAEALAAAVAQQWQHSVGSLIDVTGLIRVDSRQFFHNDGRKRGFGSSAAVCAGICAALAWLHPDGRTLSRAHLAQIAVQAHRRFQNGKGSGYDVMTAIMGGTGFFQGGEQPVWLPATRLDTLLQPLFLLNAPQPVSTPQSILGFSTFRNRHPQLHAALRDRSRTLHTTLMQLDRAPSDRTQLIPLIDSARRLSEDVGRAIGIPAEPHSELIAGLVPPPASGQRVLKAAGAGGETFIACGWSHRPHYNCEPINVFAAALPLPGIKAES